VAPVMSEGEQYYLRSVQPPGVKVGSRGGQEGVQKGSRGGLEGVWRVPRGGLEGVWRGGRI
jgi:hypothetical protein